MNSQLILLLGLPLTSHAKAVPVRSSFQGALRHRVQPISYNRPNEQDVECYVIQDPPGERFAVSPDAPVPPPVDPSPWDKDEDTESEPPQSGRISGLCDPWGRPHDLHGRLAEHSDPSVWRGETAVQAAVVVPPPGSMRRFSKQLQEFNKNTYNLLSNERRASWPNPDAADWDEWGNRGITLPVRDDDDGASSQRSDSDQRIAVPSSRPPPKVQPMAAWEATRSHASPVPPVPPLTMPKKLGRKLGQPVVDTGQYHGVTPSVTPSGLSAGDTRRSQTSVGPGRLEPTRAAGDATKTDDGEVCMSDTASNAPSTQDRDEIDDVRAPSERRPDQHDTAAEESTTSERDPGVVPFGWTNPTAAAFAHRQRVSRIS